MEERKYLTLEERKKIRKENERQRKIQEKEAKRNEKASHKKGTRRKKFLVFIILIATLFCISFSITAFIIINANQLTFNHGTNSEMQDKIQELERLLEEKNQQIEILISENENSPSFSD